MHAVVRTVLDGAVTVSDGGRHSSRSAVAETPPAVWPEYDEWRASCRPTYPRLEECQACHGTGQDPFADRAALPCYRCDGRKVVVAGSTYNGPVRAGWDG